MLEKKVEMSRVTRCKEHPHMEKTHICVPCDRDLCLECHYTSHAGHEKVLLKDKFDEAKARIETVRDKHFQDAQKYEESYSRLID